MNIKVELIQSKEYFETYYRDWLPRSKTKWLPWFGGGFILIGILLYFYASNSFKNTSIVISIWGVIMFIQYYLNKRNWIKERMKSNIVGKELTLTFKDEEIEHTGPYSKGITKWETFQKYFLTENGLTLVPENGIIIFIPHSAFESEEDILKIEKKLKSVKV